MLKKDQDVILKVPLFHTPACHFSQNGHDTMRYIADKYLAMTDSLRIFGGIFCSYLSWNTDQTQ